MFKMKIKMNEEKIIAEGLVDLTCIYRYLDELFAEFHLLKEGVSDGEITYCGTESNDDFGRFGSVTIKLWGQTWFEPNCLVWILGDNEMFPGQWDFENMLGGSPQRGEL